MEMINNKNINMLVNNLSKWDYHNIISPHKFLGLLKTPMKKNQFLRIYTNNHINIRSKANSNIQQEINHSIMKTYNNNLESNKYRNNMKWQHLKHLIKNKYQDIKINMLTRK